MKVAIVYHYVDWDGVMSAAIAKRHYDLLNKSYKESPIEITLIPANYGEEPDIDELLEFDQVVIVDFSLGTWSMKELNDSNKLIWIDHHKSAIDRLSEAGVRILHGMTNTEYAACELTYMYFEGTNEVLSLPVQQIGKWDTFRKGPAWKSVVKYQLGLRSIECTVETAMGILNEDTYSFSEILERGSFIYDFKMEEAKIAMDRAWKVQISDCPWDAAYAVLVNDMSSLICMEALDSGNMDVLVMINRYDSDRFKISVRVSESCGFDAAEFCKYVSVDGKGGGHEKAAGGLISLQQFIKLYSQSKLGPYHG